MVSPVACVCSVHQLETRGRVESRRWRGGGSQKTPHITPSSMFCAMPGDRPFCHDGRWSLASDTNIERYELNRGCSGKPCLSSPVLHLALRTNEWIDMGHETRDTAGAASVASFLRKAENVHKRRVYHLTICYNGN